MTTQIFTQLFINPVMAQAAPAPGGGLGMPIMMFLFMGAFYFLLIAPQRKKQKEHEKMITELKAGADVVTNGGIYGKITKVKEDRFVLQISESTKIEIAKASIATLANNEKKDK